MSFFLAICLLSLTLFANPSGQKVIKGNVKFENGNKRLRITASDKAVIHWQDFSIDGREKTTFVQPSNDAVLLNRVVGKNPSQIFGSLEANGKIYLINPHGVLVGNTGIVDTNGFMATTLEFSNENFFKGGNLLLEGNNKKSIVNLGTITAKDGSVYLLGYEIKNAGSIQAKNETVGLAGANKLVLQTLERNKLFINIDKKSLGMLENSGNIEALKIELQGSSNPFTFAINNSGQLLSSKLENKNGEIFIRATQGKVDLRGSIINDNGLTTIEADHLKMGEKLQIQDLSSGKIKISTPENRLVNYGILQTKGGILEIDANKSFVNMGLLDCSANIGGKIAIKTNWYTNHGKIHAEGIEQGGQIQIHAEKNITETASAITSVNAQHKAGIIELSTGKTGRLFSSGTHKASASIGGEINFLSYDIALPGANLVANGEKVDGQILLSKEKHLLKQEGNIEALTSAKKDRVSINSFTKLLGKTISSAETLSLLGDSCDLSNQVELVDPNEGTGAVFGDSVEVLRNGNIVVTKPDDNGDGMQNGAFHLYNGTTAQLISTIRGENEGDRVGSGGIVVLEGNNNFVVSSPEWQSPYGATAVGAVTWGSGTIGVSGFVNNKNSLYGTHKLDRIGKLPEFDERFTELFQLDTLGITPLKNGNYVVSSPYWNNSSNPGSFGAATWISGANGKDINGKGPGVAVSTINSLYGSTPYDKVGFVKTIGVEKGNYVVLSPFWNGVTGSGGAVTLMNGTTAKDLNNMGPGIAVSTINSLYGKSNGDRVGIIGTSLTSGKYVVVSPEWNSPGATSAGAVTLMNSTTAKDLNNMGPGIAVSTINSLYGTTVKDQIGSYGVVGLENGNYVVLSPSWNGVTGEGGAVTLMNANGTDAKGYGPSTIVSTANSLYGSTKIDKVGQRAVALTSGNYVVQSFQWNGVTGSGGAVTLMNGRTGKDARGTHGPGVAVSTNNSLYGTNMQDSVGFVEPLTNGNYVVLSPTWSGFTKNSGAVTLMNGHTGKDARGTHGPGVAVSTLNSLYGKKENEGVLIGATPLVNGNYVVLTPLWVPSSGLQNGAAILLNGTTGKNIDGNGPGITVNTSTSLYGNIRQFIGLSDRSSTSRGDGALALDDGNYVVLSAQ